MENDTAPHQTGNRKKLLTEYRSLPDDTLPSVTKKVV